MGVLELLSVVAGTCWWYWSHSVLLLELDVGTGVTQCCCWNLMWELKLLSVVAGT